MRKLSPDDRLIGSAKLAMQHGIAPAYIAVGIAAGIKRYLDETVQAQTRELAEATLSEISHLDPNTHLAQMVLDYYEMIRSGSPLQDLLAKAAKLKHSGMDAVV